MTELTELMYDGWENTLDGRPVPLSHPNIEVNETPDAGKPIWWAVMYNNETINLAPITLAEALKLAHKTLMSAGLI